jgi:hypothetical protein
MDQVTMEIDKELLQAGLTVVVVVVRGDGNDRGVSSETA